MQAAFWVSVVLLLGDENALDEWRSHTPEVSFEPLVICVFVPEAPVSWALSPALTPLSPRASPAVLCHGDFKRLFEDQVGGVNSHNMGDAVNCVGGTLWEESFWKGH